MKKILTVLTLCVLAVSVGACQKCESEPIVEQNKKLIVPKTFGQMPK